jgi:elongation factor 3
VDLPAWIDKALAGISRSKIRNQLLDVGFDEARQADIVGGLSGGWKMKLELARAMLYNADLLLLDEVTPSFTLIRHPVVHDISSAD